MPGVIRTLLFRGQLRVLINRPAILQANDTEPHTDLATLQNNSY